MILGALLFGAGVGALVFGLAQTRRVVVSSAADLIDEPEKAPADASLIYRAIEPALNAGARVVQRLSPAGRIDLIRMRIVYAGMEGTTSPERILGLKAVAAVAFFFFGMAIKPPLALPPIVVALFLGFAASFVPDMWLDSRAKDRQQRLARDLPEALDLLAISVEAGLGLEQAVEVVTENLHGPLGDEFTRMLRESELGVTRREALNELRFRTDVPELSSFVVALVQADQVGAPIADVLKVQAEQVRLKRRQRAKEKAAQLPVKILFPLIFFIFPSLFVVTIGPGAISIVENLLNNI